MDRSETNFGSFSLAPAKDAGTAALPVGTPAHEPLHRAEKMRIMGEMASGIVHDFNNLLGAIIGRTQLARSKTDLEEIRKNLAQIEKIALQGGETVKRLQVFTRRGGHHELIPTDLNQVATDALEVTRHRWESQAQGDGIVYNIEKKLHPEHQCTVSGVHSELVDAVANLILNAIDAMADGGPLTIETQCQHDINRLIVGDCGVGMTPAQIEEIFYPFYTTKGSRGTGLGLAVVYGVVKRHRGEIRVESTPGQGSRFIIELPRIESVVETVVPDLIVVDAGGRRILLVDDDQTILDVMGEALGDVGHDVKAVDNGAMAIMAMQEERFDVVITDLGMPGITGWEVARRAAALTPPLPVVVISGWGAQLDDAQLQESKIDAVLAKPFHLHQLRQVVMRVTATSSPARPQSDPLPGSAP